MLRGRVGATLSGVLLVFLAAALGRPSGTPAPPLRFALVRDGLGQAAWTTLGHGAAPVVPVIGAPAGPRLATVPAGRGRVLAYGLLPWPMSGVLVDGRPVSRRAVRGGVLWWAEAARRGLRVSVLVDGREVGQLGAGGTLASGADLPALLDEDALSAAAAVAAAAEARASAAGREYPGLRVTGYGLREFSPSAAGKLGLAVPAGTGPVWIGLVDAAAGRAMRILFAAGASGRLFPAPQAEGTPVPLRLTGLRRLGGGMVTSLAAPVIFDPGPPAPGRGLERTVQGYFHALTARDIGALQPFATRAFLRAEDNGMFGGLSNPHPAGYQWLAERRVAPGVELVVARVYSDYAGFAQGFGIVGWETQRLLVVDRGGRWRIAARF